MKLYRNILAIFGSIALLATACEDAYNDTIDASDTEYVSNDPQHRTELDNWLEENFSPYNIEVKYRWDASELDLFRTLTPPSADKVQGVMQVVKDVWIAPYIKLAGEKFIKDFCPKQFVLVGSASYNFDGTIKLGTAEGGRKIVLYVINDFEPAAEYAVKQLMHTIEHEFAHILHQNINYSADFREITTGDYTANWNLVPLSEARAKGFITSYAMSAPDEDFVEMISMMLIEGKEGYEAILECETTPASRELIRRKEQIVVEYFKETYGIDFYALQKEVQLAIREITGGDEEEPETQPVLDVWGYDKDYTSLRFDLGVLNEPDDFVARYNLDNQILHQEGYALDFNFKLNFTQQDELTLTLYYYAMDSATRVYEEANFVFSMVPGSNGAVELRFTDVDANGSYLIDEAGAYYLVAFFANRSFVIDWTSLCNGEESYVGLYPTDSPENYAFGILGN